MSYLAALGVFVDSFDRGPGADPTRSGGRARKSHTTPGTAPDPHPGGRTPSRSGSLGRNDLAR